MIMASQITSQREENFEDPEKFRPERWLTNRMDDDFQEYSYLPFGHGVRSCLGRHMAEIKMALLTAKVNMKMLQQNPLSLVTLGYIFLVGPGVQNRI